MPDDPGNPWAKPSLRIPPPNGENSRRKEPRQKTEDPLPFTPKWHEQRGAIFREIARKQHGVQFTDVQRKTSSLALDLAELERGMLGFEEAKAAYGADGPLRLR